MLRAIGLFIGVMILAGILKGTIGQDLSALWHGLVTVCGWLIGPGAVIILIGFVALVVRRVLH